MGRSCVAASSQSCAQIGDGLKAPLEIAFHLEWAKREPLHPTYELTQTHCFLYF